MAAAAYPVSVLPSDSALLKDIVVLADRNSKHLGFFPKSAWKTQAAKGHVLVATHPASTSLLGYILYYVARGRAVVQQLCVADNARRCGVGKALIHELVNRTDHLRGISLHCARDFPARGFWLRAGFQPIDEKPGRGKTQRTLVQFWLEHSHPGLFDQAEADHKERVVVDANVFYDLRDATDNVSEVQAVFSVPWLEAQVDLCITQELFVEIDRQRDDAVRRSSLRRANFFEYLRVSDHERRNAEALIGRILGDAVSPQSRSDHAHLALTIAAGVRYFITCDRRILGEADLLGDSTGLTVMDPVALLVHFDEIRSSADYAPGRLGGSCIGRRRPTSDDLTCIVDRFHLSARGGRKHELRNELNCIMRAPDFAGGSLVEDGEGEPIALLGWRRSPDLLTLRLVRCMRSMHAPTVMRHLLMEAIIVCRDSRIAVVEVSEPYIDDVCIGALRDLGFARCRGVWVKVNVFGAMTIAQVDDRLRVLEGETDGSTAEALLRARRALRYAGTDSASCKYLRRIETQLSPLRILDTRLKNWIVPIQQRWAQELFDYKLAERSLLPTDPQLALGLENVYYRSAVHGRLPDGPGHVLWYVSASDEFGDPGEIRACSGIDDVTIDTPSRLYARYRRLGVYEMKHLAQIAQERNRVLSFRFSGSELFAEVTPWKDFSVLCREFDIDRPPLSMPWQMPTELFAKIYSKGTRARHAS